jgi:hypothetical protein
VAGEVPVSQQQHAWLQGAQQAPRKLLLAGPRDTIERGIDDGVSAALGQRHQPQLRVTALSYPERRGVSLRVGRIQARAVPGHQPQPERERA